MELQGQICCLCLCSRLLEDLRPLGYFNQQTLWGTIELLIKQPSWLLLQVIWGQKGSFHLWIKTQVERVVQFVEMTNKLIILSGESCRVDQASGSSGLLSLQQEICTSLQRGYESAAFNIFMNEVKISPLEPLNCEPVGEQKLCWTPLYKVFPFYN